MTAEAPSFERCIYAFARMMDLSVEQLTALLESYDLRLVPRSVSLIDGGACK